MPVKGLIKRTERYNRLLEAAPGNYLHSLDLYEYQLMLELPEALRQSVVQLKKEFSERYESAHVLQLKPQVTLARFSTWEMMEAKLLSRLQQIAMERAPFKVELKDFGSLPSHSIFIEAVSKLPLTSLVTALKEAQRFMKADPAREPHFIQDFFVTIGHKLLPWQFENAWREYAHRQFSGRFMAGDMLLLKRAPGEKKWKLCRRFAFESRALSVRQCSMF